MLSADVRIERERERERERGEDGRNMGVRSGTDEYDVCRSK